MQLSVQFAGAPPRLIAENEKAVREKGIHFVGAGISGGEEGALKGPSIMPGGSAESYATLGPILASMHVTAREIPQS